ncbi:38816_t:CDS:2 [Gigaspora margarita]|uniref:38816_t:CDS:1 n=1 Tax=Gigaspora margarita TaxID=4874 RepID=A0ABN7V7W1_GIGMA|nr:38816_t:CDS:2 [Gigaspora margarita]
MRRRNRYKYRIIERTKEEEKEKILTIMIIDEEEKEVIKIANESWPLKEKVYLIALVIVIVIHRNKAEIEIKTNMDIMVKIVEKINNLEYERSETIKEKLGHMTNTIRIMKEYEENNYKLEDAIKKILTETEEEKQLTKEEINEVMKK